MDKETLMTISSAVESLIESASAVAPTGSASLAAALAVVAEVRGDIPGALAAYEATHQARPEEPVHANNLAYAMARFGEDLERALDLVLRAQRKVGEPVASYMDTEAWVRYRLGQFEQAKKLMGQTLHALYDQDGDLSSAQSEMLYHYAIVLEAAGLDSRALWRDCARRGTRTPYGQRCLDGFQRSEALRAPRGD